MYQSDNVITIAFIVIDRSNTDENITNTLDSIIYDLHSKNKSTCNEQHYPDLIAAFVKGRNSKDVLKQIDEILKQQNEISKQKVDEYKKSISTLEINPETIYKYSAICKKRKLFQSEKCELTSKKNDEITLKVWGKEGNVEKVEHSTYSCKQGKYLKNSLSFEFIYKNFGITIHGVNFPSGSKDLGQGYTKYSTVHNRTKCLDKLLEQQSNSNRFVIGSMNYDDYDKNLIPKNLNEPISFKKETIIRNENYSDPYVGLKFKFNSSNSSYTKENSNTYFNNIIAYNELDQRQHIIPILNKAITTKSGNNIGIYGSYNVCSTKGSPIK